MVSKYKSLNAEHKKVIAVNAELTAELARLKASGAGATAAPSGSEQ